MSVNLPGLMIRKWKCQDSNSGSRFGNLPTALCCHQGVCWGRVGWRRGWYIDPSNWKIGSGFRITEVRPTRGLHLSTEDEDLLKWFPYPALRSADWSSSTFFSYEFWVFTLFTVVDAQVIDIRTSSCLLQIFTECLGARHHGEAYLLGAVGRQMINKNIQNKNNIYWSNQCII